MSAVMKTAQFALAALALLSGCSAGAPQWASFGPAEQYERVDDAERAFVRQYNRFGTGAVRKTPERTP